MSTTLYLVRNASTAWSAEHKLLGRRDQGLNERGQVEVERVADCLATVEITYVVSSPLVRTLDTAAAIARRHGIGVTRDVRLIDIELGSWEGRQMDAVERTPEFDQFRVQPLARIAPDVESLAEVRERVLGAFDQLLGDSEVGAKIVVVTHALPIRLMLAHYLDMKPAEFFRLRISPASISVVGFEGTRPRILAVNHTAHLSEIFEAGEIA